MTDNAFVWTCPDTAHGVSASKIVSHEETAQPGSRCLVVKRACLAAASGQPPADRPMTDKAVKNHAYFLDFSKQRVALKNGHARQGTHPENFLEVRLTDYVICDLDSDGKADAAVILAASPMGSGSFFEMIALTARESGAVFRQSNSIHLGDRIIIHSLSCISGTLVLDATVHGAQDPSCCPSKSIIRYFKMINGKLMESRP